jgi:hypothetical protein
MSNQYIEPEAFMKQMDRHWTTELQNISNTSLKESWKKLAELFQDQIQGVGDEETRTKWRVFSPPTGTGKTEGTVLYASMLGHFEDHQHPGVLIIVRLIEDCVKIADRVNDFVVRYGYRQDASGYAIDYHSKQERVDAYQLKDYPVLVMTHEAYKRALESLEGNPSIKHSWKVFHSYRDSHRKLIVIDEALDIVEHVHMSYGELSRTLSSIDLRMQRGHKDAVQYIKCILDYLEKTDGEMGEDEDGEGRVPPCKEKAVVLKNLPKRVPDFNALIKDMGTIRFDHQDRREDLEWNRKRYQHHVEVIKGVQTIARLWAFHSKEGAESTINSARVLIPPGVSGPVVLDATGKTNKVYELHKKVISVQPPDGCRSYQNLTIHTAITNVGIGKRKMVLNGKKMVDSLIEDLNSRLTPADKVLVVCHKKNEHHMRGLDTNFQLYTTHWGALDGSNAWRDCNVVVIFGVPYMPSYWSANTVFSLKEEKPTKGSFTKSFWKLRRELENSKILTDFIQAINRIQTRRVVDEDGNCPVSGCYLLLSSRRKDLCEHIQAGLKSAMPGVRILDDWDFLLTEGKKKVTKSKEVFIKFTENMEPDSKISVSLLRSQLNIGERTLKQLLSDIHKDTVFKELLESRGVDYILRQEGSTSRGYLVKAA